MMWSSKVTFIILMLSMSLTIHAFRPLHIMKSKQSLRPLFNHKIDLTQFLDSPDEQIIIEIVATSSATNSEQPVILTASSRGVYREEKEQLIDVALSSPIPGILSILFNPLALVLALYFSSLGISRFMWVQKLLRVFGKGKLANKSAEEIKAEANAPFKVFECESCQMELRPAKGREEAIFARPRFRCARCGAKASAYFNIADMNDPRAVARLERIAKEKDEAENYVDEDEEEPEDDNTKDKDRKTPPRKK